MAVSRFACASQAELSSAELLARSCRGTGAAPGRQTLGRGGSLPVMEPQTAVSVKTSNALQRGVVLDTDAACDSSSGRPCHRQATGPRWLSRLWPPFGGSARRNAAHRRDGRSTADKRVHARDSSSCDPICWALDGKVGAKTCVHTRGGSHSIGSAPSADLLGGASTSPARAIAFRDSPGSGHNNQGDLSW